MSSKTEAEHQHVHGPAVGESDVTNRPDMKINPGGQIDNAGNELGPVGGSAQGLGGVGETTAGGGHRVGDGGGTVPGRTREGQVPAS